MRYACAYREAPNIRVRDGKLCVNFPCDNANRSSPIYRSLRIKRLNFSSGGSEREKPIRRGEPNAAKGRGRLRSPFCGSFLCRRVWGFLSHALATSRGDFPQREWRPGGAGCRRGGVGALDVYKIQPSRGREGGWMGGNSPRFPVLAKSLTPYVRFSSRAQTLQRQYWRSRGASGARETLPASSPERRSGRRGSAGSGSGGWRGER